MATPQIVARVLVDLRAEAAADPELFDVRAMVVEVLTNDRRLAVEVMIEVRYLSIYLSICI